MNNISSRIQLERYVSFQKLVQKCRILSGKRPLSWFNVSDPLLRLPQSVYWSVWQEPEAPVVWTPTGTPERGCGCVCFGRAHMVHWPPRGSIQGCSRRDPTLCDHMVSPRKLAHPMPPRHGDSAQRVHGTSKLAFDNLHTFLIVFYANIIHCLLFLHFFMLN